MNFTLTEEFPAPPEAVFATISDIEGFAHWMPNFVSVERLTDGPTGVGTQFRETRRMFGKDAHEHFEVTAFELNRCLTLLVDGSKGTTGKGRYEFVYTFDATATGTRMTMEAAVSGMGLSGKLMGWMMKPMFKKAIAKDHAALRSYVAMRASAAA